MNKVNTAAVTTCEAISVAQIIMDDSNYLTFWGQVKTADGWQRCDFVTSYDVLNAMLRHAQERGDAVQMAIVQHLEDMRHIPEMIDLEAELGGAVVFNNMQFSLSRPGFRQHGNWVEYTDGDCYYIEKVVPVEKVMPQPAARTVAYQEQIGHCMDMLYKSYELYLGYLELDFGAEEARREAGLEDDLKYTLAYYAWQQEQAA